MTLHRPHLLPALFLFGIFALSLVPSARAAEDEKEKEFAAEAKEAEEEDTANIGKDFTGGHELIARGKFKLYADGESDNPQVIGLFAADGKMYQVKAANESVKKELVPQNGKEVGLAGKLRNKGKYFVVEMLMNSAPPPDSFRNPRGL